MWTRQVLLSARGVGVVRSFSSSTWRIAGIWLRWNRLSSNFNCFPHKSLRNQLNELKIKQMSKKPHENKWIKKKKKKKVEKSIYNKTSIFRVPLSHRCFVCVRKKQPLPINDVRLRQSTVHAFTTTWTRRVYFTRKTFNWIYERTPLNNTRWRVRVYVTNTFAIKHTGQVGRP